MDKPLLTLHNVQKSYHTSAGRVQVLKGINLSMYAGKSVAIVGQSGSGKSTFMHLAGLLETPNSGDITIEGRKAQNLSDTQRARVRNQKFGFVYQRHHLLKEFTALENVMMPATIAGDSNTERAQHLLAEVKLEHRTMHYPSQLSGGEQQRVAIARALMNQPRILLADEPTGNLDEETAQQVEALFFKLVKEEGMSLLLVTHNPALAQKCDVVYHMQDGLLSAAN